HALGWTTIRVRQPTAADRWTWLLAAAVWQLWLARPLVADRHLAWERPRAPAHLSPGRVRRACAGLVLTLGSPARAPQTRGKSPGRRPGHSPGPIRAARSSRALIPTLVAATAPTISGASPPLEVTILCPNSRS